MSFFEWFYKCLIVQGICVFIIVLSVLLVKFFGKNLYEDFKEIYREHLLSDTSVSEVLGDEF